MSLSPEQQVTINAFGSSEHVDQDRLDAITHDAERRNSENPNPALEVARQAVQTALKPEAEAALHKRVALEQSLAASGKPQEEVDHILAANGFRVNSK